MTLQNLNLWNYEILVGLNENGIVINVSNQSWVLDAFRGHLLVIIS